MNYVGFKVPEKGEWTIKDTTCSEANSPIISFSRLATAQLFSLMLEAGKEECGAYGITVITEKPCIYHVRALYIPVQRQTAGHVDADFPNKVHTRLLGFSLEKLALMYPGETITQPIGLWTFIHSHHNLGIKGFSTIDDDNVNRTNKASVVVSWEGAWAIADTTTPCGKTTKVDAFVDFSGFALGTHFRKRREKGTLVLASPATGQHITPSTYVPAGTICTPSEFSPGEQEEWRRALDRQFDKKETSISNRGLCSLILQRAKTAESIGLKSNDLEKATQLAFAAYLTALETLATKTSVIVEGKLYSLDSGNCWLGEDRLLHVAFSDTAKMCAACYKAQKHGKMEWHKGQVGAEWEVQEGWVEEGFTTV